MGATTRRVSLSVITAVLCLLALNGRQPTLNYPMPAANRGVPETVLFKSQPPAHLPGAWQSPQSLPSGRWHGLIQFDQTPDARQHLLLEAAGVRLLGYIPQNSWVASLPADSRAFEQISGVTWYGMIPPAHKVAPAILAGQIDVWARRADGRVRLTVRYHVDVAFARAAAAVREYEASIIASLPALSQLVIDVPEEAIPALAAEDLVAWIEPVPSLPRPLNDGMRQSVGANGIDDAPYELDGSGVRVGVWDLGAVDPTHADLAGRVTIRTDLAVSSHATHVAGTLAGDGSNSLAQGGNERQWRGLAPGVELFSFNYGDVFYTIADAIAEDGIQISQNSWGLNATCGRYGEYNLYATIFDDVVNGIHGLQIPVVFSAGNDQQSCASPYGSILSGPQAAKNVITVGAVNSDDLGPTETTSWGPTADGRLKPELVAPGDEVGGDGAIRSTVAGGGYGQYAGTSMAAPVVSGSLALLLQHYQQTCLPDTYPTPATARALLIHAAVDLGTPGPDYATGFGLLDVKGALDMLPHHLEGTLSEGLVDFYEVAVAGSQPLKVTLAWDDPTALANAALALVNDLDLQVLAPDGTVYGPWLLEPENPGQPAARPAGTPDLNVTDTLNVVEQVVVTDPGPGTWTVIVRGTQVPEGPQSYTLVSDVLLSSICLAPSNERSVFLPVVQVLGD